MVTGVLGGAVIIALVGFVRRDHTIEYSAEAEGCSGRVVYATDTGDVEAEFADRWESGPVNVVHGETASVVVSLRGACGRPVECGLVEDGEEVAAASGRRGAICTAFTAR